MSDNRVLFDHLHRINFNLEKSAAAAALPELRRALEETQTATDLTETQRTHRSEALRDAIVTNERKLGIPSLPKRTARDD